MLQAAWISFLRPVDQTADPSSQLSLITGAERSEALAARWGGTPRGVAGVGRRDANQ
jgi:hypothetical protein